MAKTLIATATASSSSSLSFTSGIDSTYDVYEFHFVNMHPSASNPNFAFQVNAVGQSGYNETIQSSAFRAYHNEGNTSANLEYRGGDDQANGTSYQIIAEATPNAVADNSVCGILTLWNPASTTYVKHFTSRAFGNAYGEAEHDLFVAGYINTTSAIDEIDFKFSSGNIDAGTIKMYGVATS